LPVPAGGMCLMKPASKITNLKKEVSVFEQPDPRKSAMQIVNTIVPYVLLCAAAYTVYFAASFWLALPFIVLASGFLIRTFILFHDCCHQSLFKNRKANDLLGTITGVMTHVPYRQWKYEHSVHHATSGNLDKKGTGDIWLMTVEEYAAAPWWQRLFYRIYRNPLVMFGIGPFAVFLIQYRFNRKGAPRRERLNTWLTNALLVAMYAGLYFLVGWQALLAVQLPIFFLSGMFGVWLFYVQHNFERSYFERDEEWEFVLAAVEGSSFYKLPKPLQWITGNIGFHHVHHLNSRVPNYLLEEAHRSSEALQKAPTITLATSLRSLRFRLWDESIKDFRSFREAGPLIRALRAERRANAKAAAETSRAQTSRAVRRVERVS